MTGPITSGHGTGSLCQAWIIQRYRGSSESTTDGTTGSGRPASGARRSASSPLHLEPIRPPARRGPAEVEPPEALVAGRADHFPVEQIARIPASPLAAGRGPRNQHGVAEDHADPARDRPALHGERAGAGHRRRTPREWRRRTAWCAPGSRGPSCSARRPRRSRPAPPCHTRRTSGRWSWPCGPGCEPWRRAASTWSRDRPPARASRSPWSRAGPAEDHSAALAQLDRRRLLRLRHLQRRLPQRGARLDVVGAQSPLVEEGQRDERPAAEESAKENERQDTAHPGPLARPQVDRRVTVALVR